MPLLLSTEMPDVQL